MTSYHIHMLLLLILKYYCFSPAYYQMILAYFFQYSFWASTNCILYKITLGAKSSIWNSSVKSDTYKTYVKWRFSGRISNRTFLFKDIELFWTRKSYFVLVPRLIYRFDLVIEFRKWRIVRNKIGLFLYTVEYALSNVQFSDLNYDRKFNGLTLISDIEKLVYEFQCKSGFYFRNSPMRV